MLQIGSYLLQYFSSLVWPPICFLFFNVDWVWYWTRNAKEIPKDGLSLLRQIIQVSLLAFVFSRVVTVLLNPPFRMLTGPTDIFSSTSLPDGELRESIVDVTSEMNFTLDHIYQGNKCVSTYLMCSHSQS